MPKAPPVSSPPYTLAELAREARMSVSQVQRLGKKGIFQKPARGSSFVRYGEEHLVPLLMLNKLQYEDGNTTLGRFDIVRSMTLEQMQIALGRKAPSAPAAPAPEPVKGVSPQQGDALAIPPDRHRHIALAPGLVLVVRESSEASVLAMAEEIRAKYARSPD